MSNTRLDKFLDTFLGSGLRCKETENGTKIAGWSPNNVKTLIVTPTSAMVEYHVINERTKGHPAVKQKVLKVDLRGCDKGNKSIFTALTSPRVLSGVEEVILVDDGTAGEAYNTDYVALGTFVAEVKNNVSRFPRLRYVAELHTKTSEIVACIPECSRKHYCFTEHFQQQKAPLRVLYTNPDWWVYGITGFLPLRPKYYELDAHPEKTDDTATLTEQMVLHRCFTQIAKPYIETQKQAKAQQTASDAYVKAVKRELEAVSAVIPLLTRALARTAAITNMSMQVSTAWKTRPIYKDYCFNKLLLSREHIKRILSQAETMFTAETAPEHPVTFTGLNQLSAKDTEKHAHKYTRSNALQAIPKLAPYIFAETVPNELRQLYAIYNYAQINGTSSLCVYLRWVAGAEVDTGTLYQALEQLAQLTPEKLEQQVSTYIASCDVSVQYNTPTQNDLADIFTLTKALLCTLHYLMFELQAEFVLDRRYGSPQDIADEFRSIQQNRCVFASHEVLNLVKEQTLYAYKERPISDDPATSESIKYASTRGFKDGGQLMLAAFGVYLCMHTEPLSMSKEDIVRCYKFCSYKPVDEAKRIDTNVLPAYDAVYTAVAKVLCKEPNAAKLAERYNLKLSEV